MSDAVPVVGVVGGGQLARMLHQAAISLGVHVVVLDPDPECSAALAGARRVDGTWTSADDLVAFARSGVDVVTFDHELSDPADLVVLESQSPVPVRPEPATKLVAQDKLHARRTFASLGLAVPAFAEVATAADLEAFAAAHGGWPVVLKSARGGYDGRGVWILESAAEAEEVLASGGTFLAEERVDIDHELAVMVARRPSGEVRAWPPFRTTQVGGICTDVTIAAPPTTAEQAAARLALDLATQIDLSGVMAVELFVTTTGAIVVNEIACRPHNSGHVTMDACITGQFEQHLRAVLDLPLGDTAPTVPAAAMVNILGGPSPWDTSRLAAALAVEDTTLHLYGKSHRPGRKLGHVNAIAATPKEALHHARAVADALGSA
jgi:5-(carboxyamino)imidazole ribonucleotide synthase